MRILVVADEEEAYLWDYYQTRKMEGVDLILSCGDLKPEYLEFLTTVTNLPVLFVRGNHDDIYDERYPNGCIDIDGQLYVYRGLRILGLGGSMRYKPGRNQYTEREMHRRVNKLRRKIRKAGGFDILLTHAAARGYGDREDLCHMGFEVFNDLLEEYKPRYMIHGHIHESYGNFERETIHPGGTRIINGSRYCYVEIEPEQ